MSKSTPLVALDKDAFDEGSVHVSNEYTFMNSLEQADLIQDWIAKLTDMQQHVTGPGFLQDLAPSRFKGMH